MKQQEKFQEKLLKQIQSQHQEFLKQGKEHVQKLQEVRDEVVALRTDVKRMRKRIKTLESHNGKLKESVARIMMVLETIQEIG